MFTGIIEATAEVRSAEQNALTIERPHFFDDIRIGSSICVSGVCLSVIAFDESSMSFDVVDETLSKTKLGGLQPGDRVNLERSLMANGRFEGHIVQGHIEAVALVMQEWTQEEGILQLEVPSELSAMIVSKGSITIDGVSLTVAHKTDDRFSVALIPHTLEHSTLGELRLGDRANIETDIVGRYVRAMLPS